MFTQSSYSVRELLRTRIRGSVYTTFRNDSTISTLRNRWPFSAYQASFHELWRLRMGNTFNFAGIRINSWIPSWYSVWSQTASPSTQAVSGAGPSSSSGRKKLSRADIEQYRSEGTVITHGTYSLAKAKGEVELKAETDPAKMSNPVQQVAVYAYVGVESSRANGTYGVLISPGAGWRTRSDGAWLFAGELPVPEDQILGYFVYSEV